MSDALKNALTQSLRQANPDFLKWALVIAFLLPVLVILYFIVKKAAAGLGVNLNTEWNPAAPPQPAQPTLAQPTPTVDPLDQSRDALVGIYKVLLGVSGAVLIAGGVYAAIVATTANGLALFALMLFVAGIAVLSKMRMYDRRQRSTDTFEPNISFTVTTEPEADVLDSQTIERVKELSRQGAPLDTICRTANPQYAQWPAYKQKAFQAVMAAVLKQYPAGAPPAPTPGPSGL